MKLGWRTRRKEEINRVELKTLGFENDGERERIVGILLLQ